MVETKKKPGAEETREPDLSSKVPKPPSRHFSAAHSEEYFAYQATIPAEEWSHLLLYGYRAWPVIKRQPAYIDKWSGPVTADDIRHRWGAGTYSLRLTDSNKSKWGELCSVVLKIEDNWESCPPVLNPAEIDENHKDNGAYVQWAKSKGLLMNPNVPAAGADPAVVGLLREVISDLRQRKPQSQIEEQAVGKILSMMEMANTRSLDVAMKSQDPTTLVKLLSEMRGMFGGGGGDGVMAVLIKGMMDQQTLLLGKLMEPKAAAGGIGQLTEAFDLIDRLQDKFGSGGKGSAAVELGRFAIDKVPETLRELKGLFSVLKAAGTAAPATAADPRARTVEATPVLSPGEMAPPGPEAPVEETNEMGALLSQFGGLLVSALNRGTTGDAFADSIDNMFGLVVYAKIAGMGKESMLAHLKAHAIWAQLEPLAPQLDKFLDDFIAYGKDDAVEEEPPDHEPADAARAGASGRSGPKRVK